MNPLKFYLVKRYSDKWIHSFDIEWWSAYKSSRYKQTLASLRYLQTVNSTKYAFCHAVTVTVSNFKARFCAHFLYDSSALYFSDVNIFEMIMFLPDFLLQNCILRSSCYILFINKDSTNTGSPGLFKVHVNFILSCFLFQNTQNRSSKSHLNEQFRMKK